MLCFDSYFEVVRWWTWWTRFLSSTRSITWGAIDPLLPSIITSVISLDKLSCPGSIPHGPSCYSFHVEGFDMHYTSHPSTFTPGLIRCCGIIFHIINLIVRCRLRCHRGCYHPSFNIVSLYFVSLQFFCLEHLFIKSDACDEIDYFLWTIHLSIILTLFIWLNTSSSSWVRSSLD